jgi:metal-responsive CopG/Arc/MetJ family transcriptional regulator
MSGTNRCVSKTISLHERMFAELDQEAARRGLNRSMLVREAVRLYFRLRQTQERETGAEGTAPGQPC